MSACLTFTLTHHLCISCVQHSPVSLASMVSTAKGAWRPLDATPPPTPPCWKSLTRPRSNVAPLINATQSHSAEPPRPSCPTLLLLAQPWLPLSGEPWCINHLTGVQHLICVICENSLLSWDILPFLLYMFTSWKSLFILFICLFTAELLRQNEGEEIKKYVWLLCLLCYCLFSLLFY